MRGSPLVLPEGSSPFDTVDAAQQLGVTFLPTVPAYLQAMLRMTTPPPLPESVRLVISAGAPLPAVTAARFREVYGRPVHVFYGASEVGGICFDREGQAAERGTLGTPVERVEVSLEAVEGGDGGEGLVVVRSPSVSPGYFPQSDPCLAGGRFKTSDLGFLRNAELVLAGRIDDLVNVRGKKVNPREVEQVLSGLSGVAEAVVLAVPAPEGIGDMVRAVVACDQQVSVEAIHAWCRDRLAPHKVPRSVIRVDAIPRTDRGKLDRTALRALTPSRPGDL